MASSPLSLWQATAPPAPETPPLEGTKRAAFAIIGAGYTGLSAALHLQEAGFDTVVLEAEEPGWGASGRNGGQIIPGLKQDPDKIERDFGPDLGPRLVALADGAADTVFDLVRRLGIDCEAKRTGWIRAAHDGRALKAVERSAAQWSRRGAPVDMLTRDQMRRLIGSDTYVGGALDRRAGRIHPLAYARGLARAAQEAGAVICGQTPAGLIREEGGGWQISCARGAVRAGIVIIATNGYTDALWPDLRRSIIPLVSAQAATGPLPDDRGKAILPDGQVVSDTRRNIRYFRRGPRGEFIMGGRGEHSEAADIRHYRHLRDTALAMFPQLDGVRWQHHWSGRVALTADHYPHLHEPKWGVYAALGYNGRGIAMATVMGKVIAKYFAGRRSRPDKEIDFPITRLRPMRFHGLWRPAASTMLLYAKIRDMLDR